MHSRTLGRTGRTVSEIGFGAWQIGGQWGRVDDAASIRTLLHAFDKGINFVDTAELYGAGHSETVIGQALRQWRGDKVYVATKAQPTVWPAPDDPAPPVRGRSLRTQRGPRPAPHEQSPFRICSLPVRNIPPVGRAR